MTLFAQKDKVNLSLGTSKKVCGYEIKKMPIGAYLKAMERIKNLPSDFLEICFPEQNLQQIFDNLAAFDETGLKNLIFGAMVAAPKYAIGLVSELTGIEEEQLTNDENIGIDGMISIIVAFFEVNKLGESIAEARGLSRTIKAFFKTPSFGSKD